MADDRELDVIIFGATGFTGKLAIKEAVTLLGEFKWGIAGRHRTRLEAALKDVGEKIEKDLSAIPVIVADVADPASLREMAVKCKVLVNCVGPYRILGEPVLKACIDAGTHQIDMAAEPQYIERMVADYSGFAKEKGSFVVHGCGFGGIPADIGVNYLEREFNGTVNSVEQYVTIDIANAKGAVMHSGTIVSMSYVVSHLRELKELRKKLYKDVEPDLKPKLKERCVIHRSKELKRWCWPYISADNSLVRLSQQHMLETQKKRPVQFTSYYGASSMCEYIKLLWLGVGFFFISACACGRNLLAKFPRFFTFGKVSDEGPSQETMDNNLNFAIHLFARGWAEKLDGPTETPPNKEMHVKVSGKDAYKFTGVALLLSAVMVLKKNPTTGGIFAPGAAFKSSNLIEELCQNGAMFEVVPAEEPKKDK